MGIAHPPNIILYPFVLFVYSVMVNRIEDLMTFCQKTEQFKAKPMDEEASRAIQDCEYHTGMVECGRQTADLLDPIWEQEFYSDKPTFKA